MRKLLLGALLLLSTLGFSQTTFYSENMGVYGVIHPQFVYPVNGFSYFQNGNISGSSNVGNDSTGNSNGYNGASGDNYVRIGVGEDFTIHNIDISQYSNINLSFGVFGDANITIQISNDEINWNVISSTSTSWTWQLLNLNISNGSNISIRFTSSGGNWWMYLDDVSLKGNSLLSTNQNTLTELNLYPNPTTGNLYLSTNTDKNIKIYDMIGNKIIDKDFTNFLDTSNLKTGVYLCEITEGENKLTKKIVKR